LASELSRSDRLGSLPVPMSFLVLFFYLRSRRYERICGVKPPTTDAENESMTSLRKDDKRQAHRSDHHSRELLARDMRSFNENLTAKNIGRDELMG
jgi:hypothetical protein